MLKIQKNEFHVGRIHRGCFLTNIESKYSCPTNKQLEYIFYLKFLSLVKLSQPTKLF